MFRDYATKRHPGTGMEKWDNTKIQEYLEGHSGLLDIRSPDGTLAACVIFNYLDKGIAPYFVFYDPAKSTNRASLGTLCILKMIEHAKAKNPGPVYLGHWVSGSQKLGYKQNFRNLEALTRTGWQPFDPAVHTTGLEYHMAIPRGVDHQHLRAP